jgi:hypothetical protein
MVSQEDVLALLNNDIRNAQTDAERAPLREALDYLTNQPTKGQSMSEAIKALPREALGLAPSEEN